MELLDDKKTKKNTYEQISLQTKKKKKNRHFWIVQDKTNHSSSLTYYHPKILWICEFIQTYKPGIS